ncbi:ATP-binding cassette domain-containing protein [Rhodocytophaga rosea]|uniref:ATP-binding cassette domain-containing protein n=1 Tax=Rhodocytophaga rosea TaxID=2704465 RepID=A0A6C0GHM3_9BACT|nr:ATP-binding cassette domain-containing protein [Rhodocytophaga rosea]QHT67536.1 ATP-binding cassette domain-containing protein [Rhodocytophaga rosea]
MQIQVENLGRKFNKDWIFRNFDTTFQSNQPVAITGANGSGKSTLLQIIAAILPATEGKVKYTYRQKNIEEDKIFRYLSLAAPYQELIEEFTLQESVVFHLQFKPFRNQLAAGEFIKKIGLEKARNKPVKNFSSGMKQRLKLGLAFFSDTPILLLDEPTSNLDKNGVDWYQQHLSDNIADRLVLICSNQPYEYEICKRIIHIQDSLIYIR